MAAGSQSDPAALVREYYDAVDAGEYETVFDLFAEGVTYDRPGQGSIDGIESLRRFYRHGRPLEDGDHRVETLVVDGDEVAVEGRFEGVQDGEAVAFGFADFFRFDGDEVVHRRTYTDRDEV